MSKMFGFPEETGFVSAGAWIASKTRKLADGRFEGVAALFASDPAQGHKGGIRCNQVAELCAALNNQAQVARDREFLRAAGAMA